MRAIRPFLVCLVPALLSTGCGSPVVHDDVVRGGTIAIPERGTLEPHGGTGQTREKMGEAER